MQLSTMAQPLNAIKNVWRIGYGRFFPKSCKGLQPALSIPFTGQNWYLRCYSASVIEGAVTRTHTTPSFRLSLSLLHHLKINRRYA